MPLAEEKLKGLSLIDRMFESKCLDDRQEDYQEGKCQDFVCMIERLYQLEFRGKTCDILTTTDAELAGKAQGI